MFNFGLGEMLLVLLVFFLVAPQDIPKAFRKLGELLASIRKFTKEAGLEDAGNLLNDTKRELSDAGIPIGGRGARQGGLAKGPEGSLMTAEEMESDRRIRTEDEENVKLGLIELFSREYSPDSARRILGFMAGAGTPEMRHRAADCLLQDPLFAFQKRQVPNRSPDASKKGAPGAVNACFDEKRIKDLSEYLASLPEKYFKGLLPAIASLPGIENLDLRRVFSGKKSALYEEYRKIRSKEWARRYPRQLAVVPTYDCDRGCEYCFSRDLSRFYAKPMDVGAFEAMLDAVDPQRKLEVIGLFGGEPTSFDALEDFIAVIEKRGLLFTVATNGLADPATFRKIASHDSLCALTFHIDRDESYTGEERERVGRNVAEAAARGRHVIFRYNLVDAATRDWGFLDAFIDAVPEFFFNFSTVFPARRGTNVSIDVENLRSFVPPIISLVDYVRMRTGRKLCRISFAKPFPLCFFRDEEFRFLMRHAAFKNICDLDRNDSTNNLTVNPDGSYHPCMALTSDAYRFDALGDLDRIPSEYFRRIQGLIAQPYLPACSTCRLFDLGVCQALCYAYGP